MSLTYTKRIELMADILNRLEASDKKTELLKQIASMRKLSDVMEIIGHPKLETLVPGSRPIRITLNEESFFFGFKKSWNTLFLSCMDLVQTCTGESVSKDIGAAIVNAINGKEDTDTISNIEFCMTSLDKAMNAEPLACSSDLSSPLSAKSA